jgi:hypothetical protein
MLFTPQAYIGIDPSRGRKSVSYAALDQHLEPVAQGKGSLNDVLAFVGGQQQAVVGVVGPSAPGQSILVDPERRTALLIPLSRGRPGDIRVAEYLLKQLGLPVYKTPSARDKLSAWKQVAVELHQKLTHMGYAPHGEDPEAEHLRLEVVPEVCFRAWLEGEALPASSTFGRFQRQLTLYDLGVNIPDPMDFFEEITRYRALRGQVPEEMIYSTARIQALAAAYLAWQTKNQPDQVARVGVAGEGYISLPAELIQNQEKS